MKIMKVVYMQECEHSSWDGGNSQRYMGEESWRVGEKFNGEYIQGIVTSIAEDVVGGWFSVFVTTPERTLLQAMCIPVHAVQRIYYGEH